MPILTDIELVNATLWQPKLKNRFLLEKFSNIRNFDALKLNLISVNIITSRENKLNTYGEDNPLELFRDFITDITMVFEEDLAGTVTEALSSISGNLDYDIVIHNLSSNDDVLQKISFLGAVFQSLEYDLNYAESAICKFVIKFKTKRCCFQPIKLPTEEKVV